MQMQIVFLQMQLVGELPVGYLVFTIGDLFECAWTWLTCNPPWPSISEDLHMSLVFSWDLTSFIESLTHFGSCWICSSASYCSPWKWLDRRPTVLGPWQWHKDVAPRQGEQWQMLFGRLLSYFGLVRCISLQLWSSSCGSSRAFARCHIACLLADSLLATMVWNR